MSAMSEATDATAEAAARLGAPTPVRPRVTILLATYNGEAFLPEQLDSILSQKGVELTVVVSDDGSTDATPALLAEAAARDPRVRLLPPGRSGSAAANFYRLLTETPLDDVDAVGFADQDDVWMPGKLARHARLLLDAGAAGVSSNVTAFDASGRRVLIRKDFPQRLADYVFETPGPGSSFLLSRDFARLVQRELISPASPARDAVAHDWLIYALARAAGLEWIIDPVSTIDYRQHEHNVVGANDGLTAAVQRIRQSAAGEHRERAAIIVDACLRVASDAETPRLAWFREQFAHRDLAARLRLARRAAQFRRRPRDRAVLAGLMLFGLW